MADTFETSTREQAGMEKAFGKCNDFVFPKRERIQINSVLEMRLRVTSVRKRRAGSRAREYLDLIFLCEDTGIRRHCTM